MTRGSRATPRSGAGRQPDAAALALAASTGGALVDTGGRLAVMAAGRGPDAGDVLAGRATVVESFRTIGGVPVLNAAGLSALELAALLPTVAAETRPVVVR